MRSTPLRYVCVAAAAAAVSNVAACSTSKEDSTPAGSGGFMMMGVSGAGVSGSAAGMGPLGGAPGAGGAVVAAGGAVIGAGGATLASGGALVGMGGMESSGGSVNIGGSTSSSDIMITGSATQCPDTTPDIPQTTISSCSTETCSNAHCVQQADLPEGVDVSLLAPCPDSSLCVPDDYIATGGQFLSKTCRSIDDAEGRCVSACIPEVSERMDQLPQADCAEGERCTPCTDPIDGTETGACNQGCDGGPTEPPYQFSTCGSEKGLCVPSTLVPEDLRDGIPVDTCTQEDHVCAPTEKVKDLDYNFPACVPSFLAPLGLAPANSTGQQGGCVPAYLALAAEPPDGTVLQDSCSAGELCAPCVNPLSTEMPPPQTGACPP